MSANDLRELQALFHRLVTAPESVGRTLDQLGIPEAMVRASVRDDARLSAIERLDLYADMYFFRIRDVLREQFERLLGALEDDAFHDLVVDFLIACPPRTPSLRDVGDRLPAFIATHALAVERPWLEDLARLEWNELDAFDAADATPLAREELAALAPELFGALRLGLVPSARTFPVAHEAPATEPDLRPGTVLVWRRGLVPRSRAVDGVEAEALALLAAGTTFERICECVAERVGEDDAVPRSLALLEQWLADELLTT